MDYAKIIISLILVIIFYLLFGRESIAKLKKGDISITRREEEPQNIKEPGNQHFCKSLRCSCQIILCSGISFAIMSGPNHLFYKENCVAQNKSIEDFHGCVKQSMTKTPLIQKFGIESFEKQVFMTSLLHIDMILPKNGTIGTSRNNPKFELDPRYEFLLFFFDKDFFFFVTNPLFVQRSIVVVHPNTSNIIVGLKVSMILIKLEYLNKYIVFGSIRSSRSRNVCLSLCGAQRCLKTESSSFSHRSDLCKLSLLTS